jgi:hypothetical protein
MYLYIGCMECVCVEGALISLRDLNVKSSNLACAKQNSRLKFRSSALFTCVYRSHNTCQNVSGTQSGLALAITGDLMGRQYKAP